MATLMGTIAFSIDAMLPAFPEIAAELAPDTPNRVQLIITSFVLGLGVGTLFTGPISDAVGRRPVLWGGAAIYCTGAVLAWQAVSLEMLLAARVVQGLGASASRVVVLAIIRDLYAGRTMAQMVSLVIVVFTLVPVFAPTIGAGIIALAGWRAIFATFLIFSAISVAWLMLRQPETLAHEHRRPLRFDALWQALREVVGHKHVRLCVLAQMLCFGMLFATLSSTQMVFDVTFGQAQQFHLWFGGVALVSATGGMLNAAVVVRLGMHRVVSLALLFQIAVGGIFVGLHLLALWPEALALPAYVVWMISVFWVAGMTLGNINAMAMEPMGHIAGMAASVITAVGTVGAVMIAVPLGLFFDGTPVPTAAGVLACAALAYLSLRAVPETLSPAG